MQNCHSAKSPGRGQSEIVFALSLPLPVQQRTTLDFVFCALNPCCKQLHKRSKKVETKRGG